ncbi:MAG: hypothetical protein HYR97_05520 [Candidatus Melainabacteria bacterium]|nr:hypothetical protein [Candidatus Melainabacteria bacterium]MBI3308856.1 hypothetical protein [Candidatus Melainabacteria bacterium]
MVRILCIVFFFIVLQIPAALKTLAQELQEQTLNEDFNAQELNVIPKEEGFLYGLQKYTGFNFLTHKIAVFSLKSVVKLKTKAKKIDVDLKIYSGWDLLRKKVKSLELKTEDLSIKDVPVAKLNFDTPGPVIIKKTKLKDKKRNRILLPLYANIEIEVNLNEVSNVINSLPKWKKTLGEINLPIPPFGTTQISLRDLNIKVSEDKTTNVSAKLVSLVNPQAELLNLTFSGKLQLEDKRLIVTDIESQVEDIFTVGTEMEEAFSDMLEDLINPVFKFDKYERKGLTINNINMVFEKDKVVFLLRIMIEPPQANSNG